jgi:hypothetical protein
MATGGSDPAYADTSLDAEETDFMARLNIYRTEHSLYPVLIDSSLQEAAEWMSTDLGEEAYFSHTDSTGRSPWDRMCDFGYCYNTWKGENIAAGFTTGAGVFQGWKDSPGHNANMLGSNYRVMGLARVYVQGSPYGWYWTNDFGGHIADPASPPAGGTQTATPTPTPTPTSPPTPTPSKTPAPTQNHKTASPSPSPTPTPIPHTVAPTPTPTPSPSPIPAEDLADVDCDSHVTGADSVRILQFVANVAQFAANCPPIGSAHAQGTSEHYLGDLDCNGVVDGRDALLVLRFIAGDAGDGC